MLIPADRVTLRSWLAWYHILAGGAGMVMVLFVVPTLLEQTPDGGRAALGIVFLGMLALFAVVLWAGILLSMRSPWGPTVATLVQVLQLPVVRVGVYLWMFFGGGYLVPYWVVGNGPGIVVGLKANLQLSWGGDVQATLVGVNLIPLVILWILRHTLPSIEARQPEGDRVTEAMSATHPIEVGVADHRDRVSDAPYWPQDPPSVRHDA